MWYYGLTDEEVQKDFEKLTEAMKKRFPRQQHTMDRRLVYKDLGQLTQANLSIRDYIDKVRDIQRRLPTNDKQLERDLINAMIDGLTDGYLKMVVGGFIAMSPSPQDLESAISILKNCAREEQ